MSEKRNEKLVETTENKKMTSNQIKQQLMNLTNSSKHRSQRLNVKNKLNHDENISDHYATFDAYACFFVQE